MKKAETILNNLKRRHYDAYFCNNTEEMKAIVRQLIPEGSTITWGGSDTIRATGLTTMLKQGNYCVYDRDEAPTPEVREEIYRKAFSCDYYLASVNAMSEDGVIVNIDGNGNRVAALTWGPRHVIFVVGKNKVCPDVEAAIKRARTIAAPLNIRRFDLDTPCKRTGSCHDCKSPDSICTYISLQRLSHPAGRTIVILVDEELGY